MIRFSLGAVSDPGRVRETNEDCGFVSDRVVALADGMGGHAGGEIASEVAINALRAAIDDPEVETLADAIVVANTAVWERGAEHDLRGMGTTMCALALVGPEPDGSTRLAMTNVGDSRIYLLEHGELRRLTEDHSLVEEMVREGRITSEEAESHPQRNVITRVLGMAEQVKVDSWELDPVVGDRYVLCSDGLFNEVDESRIAATLRRLADPQEAAHELVSQANQAGGRDNITVIVVDLVDDGGEVAERFGDRILRPRSADLAGFTTIAARDSEDPSLDDPTDSAAEDQADKRRARSVLPPDEAPELDTRPRRFTWRVLLFLVAILAVFAVAAGAVFWYADNGYFVSDDDGEVAIFRGRPGGLLWFEPSVVESAGITLDELTPVLRERIEAEPEFSSVDEATAFLVNIADQLQRSGGRVGAGSTTSTTLPSTTTTPTTPATSPTTLPVVPAPAP